MATKKQTQNIKHTGWSIQEAMMFGFVAGAVIIALLLTGIQGYKNQQVICVPNNYAGVYVSLNSDYAVVVLDQQDDVQKQVINQLSQFFKQYSQQTQSMKGGTK